MQSLEVTVTADGSLLDPPYMRSEEHGPVLPGGSHWHRRYSVQMGTASFVAPCELLRRRGSSYSGRRPSYRGSAAYSSARWKVRALKCTPMRLGAHSKRAYYQQLSPVPPSRSWKESPVSSYYDRRLLLRGPCPHHPSFGTCGGGRQLRRFPCLPQPASGQHRIPGRPATVPHCRSATG